MYKRKRILLLAVLALFFIALGCEVSEAGVVYGGGDGIETAARRSSVQTVFHITVMRISYAKELEEEEGLTRDGVEEMLAEQKAQLEKKVEELIESSQKEMAKDRHVSYLTKLEKWGYKPPAKTLIPLGALIPKGAKLPKNILVTCKIEQDKEEIAAWEKEYERDVLTISETLETSPSKAKTLLDALTSKGYTVSKERIETSDTVELLYFEEWDTSYPKTLDWSVKIEGTDTNIITGYLADLGVLEVRPVPDDKTVHVTAGYHELKSEFKEKDPEVARLEKELEESKKALEEAHEALEEEIERHREKPEKRDISKVTWLDVKYGTVKLEYFRYVTAASGVFLGNMRVREEMDCWGGSRYWGVYTHDLDREEVGVVLTNAHVASLAMDFQVHVSEDKEVMWILMPGSPFIRYTKDSDFLGSPASVLSIDQVPVVGYGVDAAVMVTSVVSDYEQYKARLGNSDNVREGDPIIMVGNPAMMQKYTTRGIISNTDYNLLDGLDSGVWLKYLNKPMYDWIRHSCQWIDAPIGIGGTSGAGITALEGPEAGKIIGLHNMGMRAYDIAIGALEPCEFDLPEGNSLISDTDGLKDLLRRDRGFERNIYNIRYEEFLKDYPDFADALDQHGHWSRVSGMSGGIPINRVKAFLQERGLDPDHFGWRGLDGKHFEK